MTNILKTISQLESETETVESYYTLSDLCDLAKSIALVEFLREIENNSGCDIIVIAAYPQISENAYWLNKEPGGKIFTLGTWARVLINGVEHLADTKKISFHDKAYNASPETVNQIIEDLKIIYADIIV
jgi:hypothetical protein